METVVPQLVDLELMSVLLESGERIPITNMYDADGGDTDDRNLACAVVAGPTSCGGWVNFGVDAEDRRLSGLEPNPRAAIIDHQKNCVTFDTGEICPLDTWLDENMKPCDPEIASWVDTFNRHDGYALRVSLTPREGLVILR